MGYDVTHVDDVPITDLSDIEDVPPDHDIRSIGNALGLDNLRAAVWYFEPGEAIHYHAHTEQEEVFYVIEGQFSLKLGQPGDTEHREVGPGTFWVAKPEIGHGHRYLGDDTGIVLALGAPPVEDRGVDPHEL